MADQSTATQGAISADKLCALSGLTDRRHRQLAAEGYFPPPIDSQYQLVPTISGLFRYYREHNQRTKEKLVNTRDEKTQKENRLLDLEIARKEGRTVERADMDALHFTIFTKQKAVLTAALSSEYPGKCVGRTASEIRVLGADLANRICDIFIQGVEAWEWPHE